MEVRYWYLTACTSYASEENSDYFAGTEDELVEFIDEKIYGIAIEHWENHKDDYSDFNDFLDEIEVYYEEISKSEYDEYMGY